MAELTIAAAVGAPPARNAPPDVRTIQSLLQKVAPSLTIPVKVIGTMEPNTLRAIQEFQRRFMAHPDGRVEPGGRTLMHLNDGFASEYPGCDPGKRRTIDHDVIGAQRWLDISNRRLGNSGDADMNQKVTNIFHSANLGHFARLRSNFLLLRRSMDDQLTFQCESKSALEAAWVVTGSPTIHLPTNYFLKKPEVRIAKIIHERSHSILNTKHAGMAPGGEIAFGVAPDDPNRFTFDQAIDNAWCYEWLVTALQPTYNAATARDF